MSVDRITNDLAFRGEIQRTWADRYLIFLMCVLAGYMLAGRGFAYLGAPPLFIGEITLLLGTIVFLRLGLIMACLGTFTSLVLAAMMAWALLRTLPFIPAYGIDAPRDSVIIMYGAFSYIIMGLLLDDARRLDFLIDCYKRFIRYFIPIVPFLFFLSQYAKDWPPNIPGTDVRSILIGPGEVTVHLAGAAVFALVGYYRPTVLWVIALLATLAMASSLNRGGMLSFMIPVFLAVILTGKFRTLAVIVGAGLVLFAAAYTAERAFTDYEEAARQQERQLRPTQFVSNVQSLIGHSDEKLEGSRRWRLEWWGVIMRDTVLGGPNFWSGRGFGLNLAMEDGFGDANHANPLRSPHNAHMTILARVGVPGIALWGLFLFCWFGMIAMAFVDARIRKRPEWSGLFLVVGCYVLAALINSTFDVALEGPMQGIWFWFLVGFGIASVMIFRFQTVRAAQLEARP